MNRKYYFIIVATIVTIALFTGAYLQSQSSNFITKQIVESAEKLFGLNFNEEKRDSLLDAVNDQLKSYESLRKITLPNDIPPAIEFNPIPVGFEFEKKKKSFKLSKIGKVDLPGNENELAFYSVAQLAKLIKSKKITSEELTKIYINRLKKYGPKLECIITLTESLAIMRARRADNEIALGKYRGLLHGIPYGAKDLLAVKGIKTTWGSVPYKDQIIDEDATVIKKLEEAGAVLIAKLSMGELAWGDVWFGGMTRNPWNLSKGSSGSSAGSAAATSAGLVAFSIGTETWGSIVSPSSVCGTSGLRPTFGRVSRKGAMALSWTMDKIGPICRSAEDCAIVFNAIYGADGNDQTIRDYPFYYDSNIKLSELKIGYLKTEFDSLKENKKIYEQTLETLRSLGAELIPVDLPKYPVNELSFILNAEAAAAFDDLTLSGKDSMLVRQIKDAWPNVLRAARFIPAVEYIQANRHRYILVQEMEELFSRIDCYVGPPFEGNNLLLTNLTGHPTVVVPNGFTKEGMPISVTFTGRLFEEGIPLAIANRFQESTDYHHKHPKLK
ncbi:MAG: amidase [Ignavibacteriales bacterium]|nr:amidase [Ignavibacteriales bacterium]